MPISRMYSTKTKTLLVYLYLAGLAEGLGNHQNINGCTYVVHPVCPDLSINFYLYTRANEHEPQLVTAENVTESYFEKARPNKFILHGFNSDFKLGVLQNIKTELLMQMDVNVWMINYSELSSGPMKCYLAAVYNLPSVAKCAALFIKKIIDLSEVIDSKEVMHLIGFSLGGQLTSQIADQMKPFCLPRITGLDPALPLFYSSHLNKRLTRNDADFVDVIHTNAMIQGQVEPCGDIDFYVNGGLAQPACDNSSDPINCNHHMAPVYFAESVRSKIGFWAWPCPSIYDYLVRKCPPRGDHQLMGEYVNEKARGIYVLRTNAKPPYAQGDWTADDTRTRQLKDYLL